METPSTSSRIFNFVFHGEFRHVDTQRATNYHHIHTQSQAPTKVSPSATAKYNKLREMRAWELAIAPAKSLPMQAFMLYMSGGGVQIFSIGIVFMLLLTPFKNIAAMNTGVLLFFSVFFLVLMTFGIAFAPFSPSDSKPNSFTTLPLQKIAYLACNLLTLAVGLWKCRSMGLLPTGTGDWVEFERRGTTPEISFF
jgi:ER membrane protein complex subunit 4